MTPDRIQFEAEDDLLHSDVQSFLQGRTYSSVQVLYNGFSYREVDLMGLRPVPTPPGPPTQGDVFPSTELYPNLNLFPVGV